MTITPLPIRGLTPRVYAAGASPLCLPASPDLINAGGASRVVGGLVDPVAHFHVSEIAR